MDANETHIASYERYHRARRTSAETVDSYVTTPAPTRRVRLRA